MANSFNFYTTREIRELTEIAKLERGGSKKKIAEWLIANPGRKPAGVKSKVSAIRKQIGNLLNGRGKNISRPTMFPIVDSIPTAVSRNSDPEVTITKTEVRLPFKAMKVDFETKELILSF